MKKSVTLLLVLALCLSMFAGCAKESAPAAPAAAPAAETPAAEAPAAEAPATEAPAEEAPAAYEPVTITLNLSRSGLGENVEYTFTEMPSHVVASGDQMADFFFDLGLENQMAGYNRGSCWSMVSQYPARDQVPQLIEAGKGLTKLSKEELLATGCDFLMGWDNLFSDKNFDMEFCRQNGIAMYFPYVCSDKASFEDVYKDYETLGQIFHVEALAAERVETMKSTIASVQAVLGDEVYANPITVFVYDSGEETPFTACQGMPGDIIKLAGGISLFDDIDKAWARPSWEEVVERNPDVILILDYDGDVEAKTEFLKTFDATKNLTAVKEGRIYSANCADMQGSVGSAGTVEIIARQLYPELFK